MFGGGGGTIGDGITVKAGVFFAAGDGEGGGGYSLSRGPLLLLLLLLLLQLLLLLLRTLGVFRLREGRGEHVDG